MNDRMPDACLAAPSASDELFIQFAALNAAQHHDTSLFASHDQCLLTRGIAHQLDASANLPQQANDLLQTVQAEGRYVPLLIGAIPFSPSASVKPQLFVPQQVFTAHGTPSNDAPNQFTSEIASYPSQVEMLPDADQYRANVRLALQHIAAGKLQKVVLARALRLHSKVDVGALLQRLRANNPHAYTFGVALAGQQPAQLIGASPELLLEKRGHHIFSHPLAGSIPRSSDPREDGKRARALLASSKDLHEHAFVVEAVRASLSPYCRSINTPPEPTLLATPTMWHLGSQVHGVLKNSTMSALELALTLHPTPAVGGMPQRAASDFLAAHEGFERDYFAGLVGWQNVQGDGVWALALRCAQVDATSATLYAGAGVVAGSDPHSEWLETSAKLRTMLVALGLPGELALQDNSALQVAA